MYISLLLLLLAQWCIFLILFDNCRDADNVDITLTADMGLTAAFVIKNIKLMIGSCVKQQKLCCKTSFYTDSFFFF